jgi:hypothetical protein
VTGCASGVCSFNIAYFLVEKAFLRGGHGTLSCEFKRGFVTDVEVCAGDENTAVAARKAARQFATN